MYGCIAGSHVCSHCSHIVEGGLFCLVISHLNISTEAGGYSATQPCTSLCASHLTDSGNRLSVLSNGSTDCLTQNIEMVPKET